MPEADDFVPEADDFVPEADDFVPEADDFVVGAVGFVAKDLETGDFMPGAVDFLQGADNFELCVSEVCLHAESDGSEYAVADEEGLLKRGVHCNEDIAVS